MRCDTMFYMDLQIKWFESLPSSLRFKHVAFYWNVSSLLLLSTALGI